MFENSNSQLEEIRSKIDIVSLISRHVSLKQAGKNFSGLCPFHTEKTPSFIVSPELQRYKCFGCQKSGDIFTFLMEYEKIDFKEALEKLAKEAGVKLTSLKPKDKKTEILFMINKLALDFYQNNLMSETSKIALDYLTNRGINSESIKTFGIGYAEGNNNLLKYLKTKANFTQQQLLDSGLFNLDNKSKIIKDKFNKRIVFPVQDEKGRIIAFSGRTLPGNDYGPKYLNSPETPIYQKRKTIYGLYQSKSAIRSADMCIICEAQTGVIACHKIGIKNIVAPLGTALTQDQLRVIKRYTNKITFAFDNDSAGQNAILKGYLMAEELELESYSINTGKYKDIDELVQGEEEKAKEILNDPQDCVSYLISYKLANLKLNQYKDYNIFIQYLKLLSSTIQSKESQVFFIEKVSELSGLDKKEILSFISKKDVLMKNSYLEKSEGTKIKTKLDLEEKLLSMIINSEDFTLMKDFNFDFFLNQEVKQILEYIKTLVLSGQISGVSLFKMLSDNFTDPVYQSIFERVYLDKNSFEYSENKLEIDIKNLFNRIVSDNKKILIKEIRNKIAIEESKHQADLNLIETYLNQIKSLSQ